MSRGEARIARWKKGAVPYGLLTPALMVLLFFLISPVVSGIFMSFFDTQYSGEVHFVGLMHYRQLFSEPRFRDNLIRSCLYVLGNLSLTVPFAYLLALQLSRKVRFNQFFQSLFLLPWIVAPAVSAILFRSLVDPVVGPVNRLLEFLTGQAHVILTEPTLATATIIIHSFWRSFPFMMLFITAGIAAIPVEVYEAARVDGATGWERFRFLTIPLTRLHLASVLIVITIWTLQDAETIWAMTQGGPGYATEMVAVRLFKESFINFHLHVGAAIGVILVVVGLVYMLIYLRLTKDAAF